MELASAVLLFGLSYHSNRDKDYNEINPGIGYEVAIKDDPVYPFATASIYLDSYKEVSGFLGGGFRTTPILHTVSPWVAVGHLHNRDNDQNLLTGLAGVELNTPKAKINLMFVPQEKGGTSSAICMWVRIPLDN